MIEPDSIINKVICGNALPILKEMPNEIIDCVMTSPPYWALRDYGTATWEGGDDNCDHSSAKLKSRYDYDLSKAKTGTHAGALPGTDQAKWLDKCPNCGAIKKDKQLGLEPTFQEYINNLCDIFDEVKRVLKPTGTCFVNLGDTYAGSGKGIGSDHGKAVYSDNEIKKTDWTKVEIPDKCLCQIPARFSIEMTNRGWILRNEIIWYKRNCLPASVTDRFTVDFEKLFFFTKNKKYYFEQQFDKSKNPEDDIRRSIKSQEYNKDRQGGNSAFHQKNRDETKVEERMLQGRNKRCVWDIPPKPCPDAHFAVYPKELCYTPIKAGCPAEVCKKCGKLKRFVEEI